MKRKREQKKKNVGGGGELGGQGGKREKGKRMRTTGPAKVKISKMSGDQLETKDISRHMSSRILRDYMFVSALFFQSKLH
jgi:hypothetical protein